MKDDDTVVGSSTLVLGFRALGSHAKDIAPNAV